MNHILAATSTPSSICSYGGSCRNFGDNVHAFDLNDTLQRGLSILTELAALGHIETDSNGGMTVASDGIAHMVANHRDFIKAIQGKKYNYGEDLQGLVDSIIAAADKHGLDVDDVPKSFKTQNLWFVNLNE